MVTLRSFLLPFDTDGSTSAAGGLGVLASDSESPLVPETAVGPHLEEPFNVFSELGFKDVGGHLQVLAFLVIADPVKEPPGHTLSFGVVDEVGDFVALLLVELTGSDPRVDPEDLADQEPKSPSHTLNLLECVGHGPLAVDVGVQDTVDVLEVGLGVLDDQRHLLSTDNNPIFI